MLLSNCVVCDNKKLRVIKNKNTRGLKSDLRLKTISTKIPILGDF